MGAPNPSRNILRTGIDHTGVAQDQAWKRRTFSCVLSPTYSVCARMFGSCDSGVQFMFLTPVTGAVSHSEFQMWHFPQSTIPESPLLAPNPEFPPPSPADASVLTSQPKARDESITFKPPPPPRVCTNTTSTCYTILRPLPAQLFADPETGCQPSQDTWRLRVRADRRSRALAR